MRDGLWDLGRIDADTKEVNAESEHSVDLGSVLSSVRGDLFLVIRADGDMADDDWINAGVELSGHEDFSNSEEYLFPEKIKLKEGDLLRFRMPTDILRYVRAFILPGTPPEDDPLVDPPTVFTQTQFTAWIELGPNKA